MHRPYSRCLCAAFALGLAAWGVPDGRAQTCTHPEGNHSFGVFGDVTGNGVPNVADSLCILLASLAQQLGDPIENLPCLAADALRADLDCDGAVDLIDVMACVSIALGNGVPSGLSPDGTGCPAACASCAPTGGSSCFIAGACVPEGDRTGADGCQVCAPATDAADWTAQTCQTYYEDADGDGAGVASSSQCACVGVGDFTALVDGDCDDSDLAIHPAAPELCDGIDNDCDGDTDTACTKTNAPNCQGIADSTIHPPSGVYSVDPDGAGGQPPYDIYCDFSTPGEGWTLALRAATASQFTFYSPYWTSATLLNETQSPGDPTFNGDAKFRPFVDEIAVEIRGCLRHPSTGAYNCRSYDLPQPTTLRDLFSSTPIGSDTAGTGGLILSSNATEAQTWLAMANVTFADLTHTPGPSYQRVGINIDDDLSCYDTHIRFGAIFNAQADINTADDTSGFGVGSYYSPACDFEGVDSPWSIGSGFHSDKGAYARQGTIWVRSESVPPLPRSCLDILVADPAASSGTYSIDVDGPGGPNLPTTVHCDMSVGFTFQLQGQVDNAPASILGGCSGGFEPFEVRSATHSAALESYVTSLGSNANAWYYANVFTGAALGCPTLARDFGWLSTPTQWNDANMDETGLLNISSNCNSTVFDPVPLNQADGYANRGNATALFNSTESLQSGTIVCGLNDIVLTGLSCQSIADATPTLPSGLYLVDPDGAGGQAAKQVYCDFETTGEGWSLAMRASTASTFTFYSPYWTNTQLLAETTSPDNPEFDGDAKFWPFVDEAAVAIRGCLHNPGVGQTACRDYDLPAPTTLRNLFATTPIGSDSAGSGSLILSADVTEAHSWLTLAGVTFANVTNAGGTGYRRVGINIDDDLSCYDTHVRFGAIYNAQANINTADDASGFGVSSYYSAACDFEGADSPWSLGSGFRSDKGAYPRRGTIWVRTEPNLAQGTSCRDILQAAPSSPSGTYLIDPDGPANPLAPVSVYCDMSAGYTFHVQGTVQNSSSSILSGCQFGLQPFQARSQAHAEALDAFVDGLGNDSGAWYYANVFAGPTLGCPSTANDMGWLAADGTTWNNGNINESGLLVINNCNLGGHDPFPLNQVGGYSLRGHSSALLNPSEATHTGNVICSVNDVPAP